MCDGEHAGELGLVDGEVRGQRPGQLLVLGPELLHQSQGDDNQSEVSVENTTTNHRSLLTWSCRASLAAIGFMVAMARAAAVTIVNIIMIPL